MSAQTKEIKEQTKHFRKFLEGAEVASNFSILGLFELIDGLADQIEILQEDINTLKGLNE
jgi:hypothetical protein